MMILVKLQPGYKKKHIVGKSQMKLNAITKPRLKTDRINFPRQYWT